MNPQESKDAVLLSSGGRGNTFAVVERLRDLLHFKCVEIQALEAPQDLTGKIIIIVCPTAGDEELHPHMEDCLLRADLRDSLFTVCELGNYYGYDVYSFGAGRILQRYLTEKGAREFYPMLSLDSSPSIRWDQLETWAKGLDDDILSRR